jgi:hypothetical protein
VMSWPRTGPVACSWSKTRPPCACSCASCCSVTGSRRPPRPTRRRPPSCSPSSTPTRC